GFHEPATRPRRLAAQDAALSRRKRRFESARGCRTEEPGRPARALHNELFGAVLGKTSARALCGTYRGVEWERRASAVETPTMRIRPRRRGAAPVVHDDARRQFDASRRARVAEPLLTATFACIARHVRRSRACARVHLARATRVDARDARVDTMRARNRTRARARRNTRDEHAQCCAHVSPRSRSPMRARIAGTLIARRVTKSGQGYLTLHAK
ncbi:MAG: hypothetical protein QOF28_2194, partial [Actinomycetota bacterium]|nr:hypothetical protein [Actinomycetota bacterium]